MRESISVVAVLAVFFQTRFTAGYTVQDIVNRCAPCTSANPQFNVPHPTDCGKYYYCLSSQPTRWRQRYCPASTFFDQTKGSAGACTDSRYGTCPINVPGNESVYVNKDILSLPQCAPSATVMMTTPDEVTPTTASQKGKEAQTTTILASLLAVTVVILIVTVLGIFLYRRRQRIRRPKNLYRRKLPESSGGAKSKAPPPAAANVSYSTRPLLNERGDSCISGIYEEPDMSEEPGYQEIPERNSKAYYSEPAAESEQKHDRPAISLPVTAASEEYMIPCNGTDNHHYSPTNPTNNGVYDKAGPEYLQVGEPYDYCTPQSAHPTLSMQRGGELPPTPESPPYYVDPGLNNATPDSAAVTPVYDDQYVDPATQFGGRPEEAPPSPPYYVDPIPTEQTNTTNYPYHTLEPLSKK